MNPTNQIEPSGPTDSNTSNTVTHPGISLTHREQSSQSLKTCQVGPLDILLPFYFCKVTHSKWNRIFYKNDKTWFYPWNDWIMKSGHWMWLLLDCEALLPSWQTAGTYFWETGMWRLKVKFLLKASRHIQVLKYIINAIFTFVKSAIQNINPSTGL